MTTTDPISSYVPDRSSRLAAPPEIGSLVQRIAGGESYAVAFGGQGVHWLEPLAQLVRDFALEGELVKVTAGADRLLSPVADEIAWAGEFEPERWLAEERESTDTAHTVAGILLTQLAGLRALGQQGVDVIARRPCAVIAHSQGVLAAQVVQGLRGDHALAYARLIGAAIDRVARRRGLHRIGDEAVMVSVSGVDISSITKILDDLGSGAVAAVRNGRRSVVVSGKPEDLAAFQRRCENIAASEKLERDAKKRGGAVFAPILEPLDSAGAAFHHPDLAEAADLVAAWAEATDLDPAKGRELTMAAFIDPVDWVSSVDHAIAAGAHWILDLGPADLATRMTVPEIRGRGVQAVATTTRRGHRELTVAGAAPVPDKPWAAFAPRLVTLPDGKNVVETAFTRLTGKSPILLAGMTPTTVDAKIVAAAANAGFWAELAGGGQVTEDIFADRIDELGELLEPGRSYSFNSLLLDPYLWKLQLGEKRLVQRARAAGSPLEGVVVTAGVPELEDAVDLIADLNQSGISHIAFKPGTIAQIRSVLAIAREVPHQPIIMHIEGGKAGGHHSWEDLDDLLIGTYAQIRKQDNIVLCVGGGIGTPERASDYLLGRWSIAHGYPAMPVDGILVGTAAMATLEATTAADVKKLLVETPGTPAWIGAGNAVAGMSSGRSQLGADIHEIDNSAARTGRLLDEVAGDAEAVAKRRDEIIAALDRTAKPYFGDVSEMTYAAWLRRFIDLSVGDGAEWADITWQRRFFEMLQRAEARLNAADRGQIETLFGTDAAVSEPREALAVLLHSYPDATSTLLHPADVHFFVEACKTPGKPVNFVPVLDGDVRRWWRSDSLWQAHDERYLADQVSIIPGPVSVAGIDRVDEPVAELLQRFEDGTIDDLYASGSAPSRVSARLRIDAARGPVSAALAAHDVIWGTRSITNPAHRLGAPSEWTIDGESATHTDTGATLTPTSSTQVELSVPVSGAADLRLLMDLTGDAPVIGYESAASGMRTLLDVASGTLGLPPSPAVDVDFDPDMVADHAGVTGALLAAGPSTEVPDVLVGLAWPAVFAAISSAHTHDGIPVVEGMLDLVHLDHAIAVPSGLPAGPTRLSMNAVAGEVIDTDAGRVIPVDVTVTDEEGIVVAELAERFALRGRTGSTKLTDPVRAGGVTQRMRDVTRRTRVETTVRVPSSMRAFATVSGDHNPIHTNLAAARLAGLGSPIAHGMWLSAVAQHVAASAEVRGWTARFLAPVRPGADVDIKVQRIGIDAGREVVEVSCKVEGELVMVATATLAAPLTVYAFPGQGIQRPGMGMDAYAKSKAAHDVWDRADKHTREALGFSILTVVRDNPTTIVADGVRHNHPDGVLYLTQFTQVAMATLGAAQTAELREAGAFVEGSLMCGHSVGEYNALAAVSGVMSLEAVLEVVFQRGSVMHTLVPRDSQGRSDYRLAAIRPSQIGLEDDKVAGFIDGLASESGEFLEIVNYNLRGSQYAIAGTVRGLELLEKEVNRRRAEHRGKAAFILVPGIDVPFHSTVLRGGVPDFRDRLGEILPAEIDPSILTGRYIPNLVPRLFSLDRAFVAEIADLVPSEPLDAVLEDFDDWATRPGALCRVVLIELLAWQFASPVRWIETQDLLFASRAQGGVGVEQFVEIGVGAAPTVANLASSTLKIPGLFDTKPTVLNSEREAAVLLGADTDPAVADEFEDDAAPAAAASAPAAQTPAAPARPATGGPRPDDIAFGPAEATTVLIASATKMRIDQVGAADSIESLCDGVSSRRNQLLVDLGAELSLGAIDGAAEADLPTLSAQVTGLARGYRPFGPVLTDAISDQTRKVLGPTGKRLAVIAERVTGEWQLGPGWAQHVTAEFALGTREGTSVRGGDLGGLTAGPLASAADVDAAIDAAVASVASRRGVSVSLPEAEGSGGTVDLEALGEFTDQITGKDGVLASAARLILEQLGHADAPQMHTDGVDTELEDLVASELGSDWPRVVAPAFDADKAVLFDDRWASAREDLARMWTGAAVGSFTAAGEIVATHATWWAARADAAGDHTLAEAYHRAAAQARDSRAGAWSTDTAVVTGASAGSIAASVVAELLAGGANVIATTSHVDSKKLEFFRQLYREHAVHGASLWLVPANMASFADVDALSEWVGTDQLQSAGGASTLVKAAQQPTLLFPFAAPRVSGELDGAGAQAEAEMRVLLWSVERLIGGLSAIGRDTDLGASLHVVLPGSPNRGMFGGDGAYGESKAALDAIVSKWKAERSWASRVTLVHAAIGWVRGTGLMGQNDPLVDAVEAVGVETWSTGQMAAKLLDQCGAAARSRAKEAPLEVDLTGGLAGADLDLAALARDARAALDTADEAEVADIATIAALAPSPGALDTTASIDWPKLDVRPEDLVVVVGAGELGPYGSARTRFEVEVSDRLSAAGVLELAWSTGLIVWEATPRAGWYDAESGDPVPEAEIVERYEETVRERCGIRTYGDDGSIVDNTAPLLTSVYLDNDLSFVVSSEAEARAFVDSDPEHTVMASIDGDWKVTRRAGTEIRVPRRMKLTRTVGGQIPAGFDPKVWGIPADMIGSLDRVALWNIVATVDAFLSSGFTPSELMRWVHPSYVANTQGTGMGGMGSMYSLYIDTLLGESKPNDLLQEALPNVIAAHVAQSYVGGYGAMIHPVGACATAAVSVEEGVDKIRLGKAQLVVSGGFDDLSAEGIIGFADMSATADSAAMRAKGIEDRYFSRANDRRRGGFVESQGGGTVLLARGDVAAEMGLPVLGVVGWASSFGDGIHTSIPAPGIGALSAGRGGPESDLARSLGKLGVTADDIAVVSKHDTSTNANDPNESELHERLAGALGRSDGAPLFVVSQKSLTGHAKGGAAAFQLIGLCQVLSQGVLPPNRSLDCVDDALDGNEHLVWVREPLKLGGFKAGLLTSLGFGHVSGLIALVHPDAFVASLSDDARASYVERSAARKVDGKMRLSRAMHGGEALYERPDHRRFGAGESQDLRELEAGMLLETDARLGNDGVYQRPSCQ